MAGNIISLAISTKNNSMSKVKFEKVNWENVKNNLRYKRKVYDDFYEMFDKEWENYSEYYNFWNDLQNIKSQPGKISLPSKLRHEYFISELEYERKLAFL